ncbi:cytochrome c peroxidase [Pseudovibrio sp. Tun.PSC04-5.I4]|uniref:cytochrome-c peroxidase n=1 Tax=Pseudovibrio sp. Tun.PSC04-5.I4 TaxID=1798213 RepID=UPI0008848A4C|nr:cytochrome c peroxidase [Pseudovibrio sp. Tun.PSC04-5.I4]SDR29877.1 cytochrome c peroxidase [Pseudovibrio sp. Tun.PSC04-5.I4]
MINSIVKTVRTVTLAGVSIAVMTAAATATERPTDLAPLGDPPIPADNPMSAEKTELGKLLFFDPRLSGNGAMPCSACHLPETGWDFPDKISLGYPGTTHWRNSPTIMNTAYYGNLFWTGVSKSLEAEARTAARGGVAGNGEDDMMETRLAFVPEYRERFKDVFGTEYPRIRDAYMAIAAFERTIIQKDTPFDNYMRGDDDALSAEQKRGMELFTGKAECSTCHSGALVSNQKYYNLGVPAYDGWETDEIAQISFRFELYAKGSTEENYRKWKDDPGLYFVTKEKADLGKFRVPSLRYTKYTAPYMHNGMLETLEDVVEFYNQGGGTNEFSKNKSKLLKPLNLNEKEKADLVAFVESFSGERFVMEVPDIPEYEPLPVETN